MFKFKRTFRDNKLILVLEMFFQKKQNHVAASSVVGRVHGHLSKEIPDIRHDDCEGPEPVPKIVECKYSLIAGNPG